MPQSPRLWHGLVFLFSFALFHSCLLKETHFDLLVLTLELDKSVSG